MKNSMLKATLLATTLLTSTTLAFASDPVVIRVEGKEIKASELKEVLNALPKEAKDQKGADYEKLLRDQILSVLLLSKAAQDAKTQDREDVKKAVAASAEQIMTQAFMADIVKAKATDAEIKKRYEDAIAKFGKPEEIQAMHILVKDEAEAKAISEQLKKGGDFAKLAMEKSMDPGSKEKGGDLDYIRSEMVVEPFWKALIGLKKGEISQPVKSDFGWHIIKRGDVRTATPPTLDASKKQIQSMIAAEAIQAKVAELKGKYKIELFDMDGKPLADAKK